MTSSSLAVEVSPSAVAASLLLPRIVVNLRALAGFRAPVVVETV